MVLCFCLNKKCVKHFYSEFFESKTSKNIVKNIAEIQEKVFDESC